MNIRKLTLTTALLIATGSAWAQAAPGPVEINGGRFVVAIDTSGSMSDHSLGVMLGEIASSLGAIESMQPGDILFFKKPDLARMLINEVPAFDVQVGNLGSQTAVQIARSVIPGLQ